MVPVSRHKEPAKWKRHENTDSTFKNKTNYGWLVYSDIKVVECVMNEQVYYL